MVLECSGPSGSGSIFKYSLVFSGILEGSGVFWGVLGGSGGCWWVAEPQIWVAEPQILN